ncbi:hypothetical protein EDB85DRAFT_1101796 [Lactarius pseudohatsudake]|nr:hypothetical protein EDB85DRAFT_1101796 [Lactarius pseudohatsudake]
MRRACAAYSRSSGGHGVNDLFSTQSNDYGCETNDGSGDVRLLPLYAASCPSPTSAARRATTPRMWRASLSGASRTISHASYHWHGQQPSWLQHLGILEAVASPTSPRGRSLTSGSPPTRNPQLLGSQLSLEGILLLVSRCPLLQTRGYI